MTERDCVISSSVPAHTMPDGSSMMSGSLNARLQEMWFPTWEQVALNAAGTGGFRGLGSMDCLAGGGAFARRGRGGVEGGGGGVLWGGGGGTKQKADETGAGGGEGEPPVGERR